MATVKIAKNMVFDEKIRKIAEENPDLTYEFIKALLSAQQEVKDGKIEEYLFTDKVL